jgi:hypothetical protein
MEFLKQKNVVEGEGSAKRSEVQVREAETLRVLELEMENFRLNRLVAELLLKNQQLRKAQ